MFFKASRFGCCKTIFDATKVTYNKYSCAMSGMSREMMRMDGRDSVEYQICEMKGHNKHFGICKTIFDATKVTYNKYSCAMSGMSREMMRMYGRDSAEYQIWEMKGHNKHFGICLCH